jgi:hypothetical protein
MVNLLMKLPKLPRTTTVVVGVITAGAVLFALSDHANAQATDSNKQAAATQAIYATPNAASDALLEALKNNDDAALVAIFGSEFSKQIVSTDKAGTRANRMRAYRAAQEMLAWRELEKDKRTLVIGHEAWPMPIPLIKAGTGWRFDTAAGVDEIINRRIGRNELSAISVSEAYVGAQKQFAGRDHDGDQVREYARHIRSSEGKRDGLYWVAKAGEEISPFGPLVAEQQEYLEGREAGDPFKGYYFKILTWQGDQAPGGRHDYLINGNMIAGFGMVAFPADYGTSGIMTFIVSHHGIVYEKDLGPESALLGRALQIFDPDETWLQVEN